MRQIVLDTETTGIGPEQGHRVIEIGCVELFDRKLTGNHYHVYLNPDREVDEGAFRVHGISTEFLKDKPRFSDIVQEFIDYVDGAELIIHNAPFDVGFLNAELKLIKWKNNLEKHCSILDTLVMVRNKHPGQRNSLDALCKRYDIDNSNRQLHGALLDSEILAFVYLAMTGGQTSLFADASNSNNQEKKSIETSAHEALTGNTPIIRANELEQKEHNAFVEFLADRSGKNYWDEH
jgi:DNA polymerase III subunit epsilon